jgi:hypothetical protein
MGRPEIHQQRAALLNAQASWAELDASAKQFEAAILRGDQAAATDARERVHAILDAYLDLRSEANQMLRKLLGGG